MTHSLRPKVKLQIPPLRCASVGMTKGRAALHLGSSGDGWTEPAQRRMTFTNSIRLGRKSG
jgi:hypothetical protein